MNEIPIKISQLWKMLAEGEFDQVIRKSTPLMIKDQNNGELLQIRGLAFRMLKNPQAAIRYLEQATYMTPLRADSMYALAESYESIGKKDLAGWMYQQVALRKDLPAEMFSPLAMQLGHLKDFQTALMVCKRACRVDRDLPEAYFAVAFYMRKLEKPVDMILPYLAQAHQLKQEEVIYRMSYASMLKKAGREQEADELLAQADIDPKACDQCLDNILQIFEKQ